MTVLLLNASYEPIRIVTIRRAVELIVTGKAVPVTASDRVVRSPSVTVQVPFVARLVEMARVPFRSTVPFSKRALAVRDGGRCQVSGCARAGDSVDHLLPVSRGGRSSWTNCVMMCRHHNQSKADRALDEVGWTLRREPKAPRGELALIAAAGLRAPVPEWADWFARVS